MKDVLEEYGEMLFAVVTAVLLVGLFWEKLQGIMASAM